jgi:hypothetical protein
MNILRFYFHWGVENFYICGGIYTIYSRYNVLRDTTGGIDATVIIVSSVLHIPQSLEKLITVLELDLPDEKNKWHHSRVHSI